MRVTVGRPTYAGGNGRLMSAQYCSRKLEINVRLRQNRKVIRSKATFRLTFPPPSTTTKYFNEFFGIPYPIFKLKVIKLKVFADFPLKLSVGNSPSFERGRNGRVYRRTKKKKHIPVKPARVPRCSAQSLKNEMKILKTARTFYDQMRAFVSIYVIQFNRVTCRKSEGYTNWLINRHHHIITLYPSTKLIL